MACNHADEYVRICFEGKNNKRKERGIYTCNYTSPLHKYYTDEHGIEKKHNKRQKRSN